MVALKAEIELKAEFEQGLLEAACVLDDRLGFLLLDQLAVGVPFCFEAPIVPLVSFPVEVLNIVLMIIHGELHVMHQVVLQKTGLEDVPLVDHVIADVTDWEGTGRAVETEAVLQADLKIDFDSGHVAENVNDFVLEMIVLIGVESVHVPVSAALFEGICHLNLKVHPFLTPK